MNTASPTQPAPTWPEGTSPTTSVGSWPPPCPEWCALSGHPGKHDAGAEELDGRLVFYVTHEKAFPVAAGRLAGALALIAAVTHHSDGVREAYVNVDAADVSMHSPDELQALAQAAQEAAAWLEANR